MSNRIAVAAITVVIAVLLIAAPSALSPVVSDLTDQPDQPTDGDGAVVATHATMHFDRVGRPTVVGEVQNDRGTAIDGVVVEVTFVDDDGNAITSVTDTVLGSPIRAGDTSPFVIRGGELDEQPAGFEVSLRSTGSAVSAPAADALVVTDHRMSDESQDQVVIVGTVENRGSSPSNVSVVATFYDENGAVVGARAVRASPGTLEAGEQGAFRIRFRTLGDVPSRARELVDYDLQVYDADRSSDG